MNVSESPPTAASLQSESGKAVGDLVAQTAESIRHMAEALEQTVTSASTVGEQMKRSYDALDTTIERTTSDTS